MYTYNSFKTPLPKTKAGHQVVGTTVHSKDRTKGANILKHKDGKYFAAGGSSTACADGTSMYDTPEAAAKAYHKGQLQESSNFRDMLEACWKGYKQLGMKDKDGKTVPNCIPEAEGTKVDYVVDPNGPTPPEGIEVEKKIEEESTQKHRVGVMVSDPNHPFVSERKQTDQKFAAVKANSKEEAVQKATAFYKKKGYKVHDAWHHSVLAEEQIDEGAFASSVKKAKEAHDRGDEKRAAYHLANAKTARYAIPSTQYSKNKEHFDTYKALASKYDQKSIEEEQIDEAAKLGSQVKIHAPGKSYHEKVGRIGEIRHGLYKGAPKTYTVDYEGSAPGSRQSIQLDRKQFKLHEEQLDEGTFKHKFKMSHDDFKKYADYAGASIHHDSEHNLSLAYNGKRHTATYDHDTGVIHTDHKLEESEQHMELMHKHAKNFLSKLPNGSSFSLSSIGVNRDGTVNVQATHKTLGYVKDYVIHPHTGQEVKKVIKEDQVDESIVHSQEDKIGNKYHVKKLSSGTYDLHKQAKTGEWSKVSSHKSLESAKQSINESDLTEGYEEVARHAKEQADKHSVGSPEHSMWMGVHNTARWKMHGANALGNESKKAAMYRFSQVSKEHYPEFHAGKSHHWDNFKKANSLSEEQLDEVLGKNATVGDYIADFQKSDAPQFAGKSKEKRRQMAIAAALSAKNEGVEEMNFRDLVEGVAPAYPLNVAKIATSHGFVKTASGFEHPKTGHTIAITRGKSKDGESGTHVGMSSKSGSTLFRGASSELEANIKKHLAEEVEIAEEQLDELSKQTLGSYIKKATGGLNGVGRHAFDSGNTLGKANGDDSPSAKSFALARKRIKGVEKATDRLMKEEEVEIVEEFGLVNEAAEDIVSEAERTDAFVYTHKPGNEAHEKKLNDLKTYVKIHNQLNPNAKKRISMKGRLGKDNPNAGNYRGKGMGSHQTIRKADASHFDVYVHDKN